MAITYTTKQLIQRIRKQMSNGFPNDSITTTDNEYQLYINQAIAYNLVGTTWATFKITGVMEVPEAYLVTYSLPPVTQDSITGDWVTTLPQPPVSLPLGYSLVDVYPVLPGRGRGPSFAMIKSKRVAYRKLLPLQNGIRCSVDGMNLRLAAADGSILLGLTVNAVMPTSRTSDITQLINLPDDAIEVVFNNVVEKLTKRYMNPKDVIRDDLPAGANNSNQ